MSALSRFLGGGKANTSSPQTAMIKIQDTITTLTKKQEFCEKMIEKEIETAKRLAKTNKRAALNALKKKKMLIDQLTHIDGTITTLESQLRTLDSAALNMEAMEAMKIASDALKHSHKNMDLDKVNRIKDEMDEQNEIARIISEEISRPAGQEMYDEDELMAELEALQEDNNDADLLEQLLDVSVPASELPTASCGIKNPPTAIKTSTSKKSDEDEQMAALAMWSS